MVKTMPHIDSKFKVDYEFCLKTLLSKKVETFELFNKSLRNNEHNKYILNINKEITDLQQEIKINKFNEYINKSEPTLEEAIKVLQKHLREDKAFYSKWKEKIGDSFWDIVIMEPAHFADEYNFKEISENAAKNFLDNLIKE